jgi:hypothetical protein
MATIEQQIIEGITYYSTVSRGTRYSLRHYKGEWELHAKRLALSSLNVGSYRFFDTLDQLEAEVKAFKGVGMLIGSTSCSAGAAKH